MPGLSAQVHFPIAGLHAQAQVLFDQGICQLHGFWFFEAERSFRQVAQLHPDCAMSYWGMAMANVENKPRAAALIARAVRVSAGVPRYEQLWIDAFAEYYRIDSDLRAELRSGVAERVNKANASVETRNATRDEKALVKKLIKDLETIVVEFPDDIESKAFLAVQNWRATDSGEGVPITCHVGIDALLDQVFQKAPLHPAHHYRVHLWDREKAERAAKSAAVLGDTAPAIAHQWHMAGHIYDKLHRYAQAAWQQEASARVDHAHMMRDRVMPFLIHNYGHNQEWLARSLSHTDRVHEALEVAKNLASLPRHPKWNTPDDEEHIVTDARARLQSVCEDHELWQEALALESSGYFDRTDSARGELPRLTLLGRAYYRLGRLTEGDAIAAQVGPLLPKARAERAAAVDKAEDEALAASKPAPEVDQDMAKAGRDRTDLVRSVFELQRELRGERLLATGDAKAALVEFEAVKDLPKTLLADALVAAGQAKKAVELLEKEVKERPNRGSTQRALAAARTAVELLAQSQPSPRIHWAAPQDAGSGAGATDTTIQDASFGPRPALASLGPVRWSPMPAIQFDLPCTDGTRRSLAGQRGKATLVVFYLGFSCLHCVQQLQAIAPKTKDFAAAGIEVLAIGNDTLAHSQEQLEALGDRRLPFPLFADPELAAFKAYRCYDDFEQMPLHGTFLIDAGGQVRWQDISSEPFMQIDWLLGEGRRLLAIPGSVAK